MKACDLELEELAQSVGHMKSLLMKYLEETSVSEKGDYDRAGGNPAVIRID